MGWATALVWTVVSTVTRSQACGGIARVSIAIRSVSASSSSSLSAPIRPRQRVIDEDPPEDEAPAVAVPCWLCGRPTGSVIVWHHPIPKSRGGRDTVPMHPICQNTIITHFTNSELQRHGMDVEGLLADPVVRKFVDWVAKKDPDFNAAVTKKQR